jgi:hypothetical protein
MNRICWETIAPSISLSQLQTHLFSSEETVVFFHLALFALAYPEYDQEVYPKALKENNFKKARLMILGHSGFI